MKIHLAALALVMAAPAIAADSFGAPVTDAVLGGIAGKADLSQLARADNSSVVSNNSVSGQTTTGALSFGGNAFQNLNGLAVVSANTGNNVSINAALNVNVAIRQ
ncbi:hypothetical protein GCM10011529_12390 [Polymorphobacter glacialis]|uniref:Uncharacterized protein n=1 Tax=Sandarakinorhabdus glacialis TaxID=1614636 RepID=A0A916ZQN3_9SPHN|nr:hypothetical protein [Polymorphobacter glacialis]GGE07524.1 hypothetical protein GCM10011529_12390 [Polymorphobacter glacialis]